MKNAVKRALAAKKQYTSPHTDIISVQPDNNLLVASPHTMPIGGGDEQIYSW